MGRKEKLYRKASESPNNLSFSELCSLAKQVGFVYRNTSGDHETYKHPIGGRMMNFQPINGKAKPYQVKQLLDFIEENDLMGA
ncbi:MAG TPA: type II toxin-antitoxin system HicA family toxin [Deltaproteobacteria bacterium]|nr:type II toxin-antitoxin system HicA family toxin [Deltaproteobacteria bacterium]